MKTEERHQLHKNELADWLGEHAASVQPYLKTLVGVGILLLVGFLAINVMRGQSEGRNEAAWSGFFEAQASNDPDTAKEVARLFPNTTAAAWAWLWAGDYELADSAGLAFTDRAEYREGLMAAKDAYEAALTANPPEIIQQRATLGLAQVHEGLDELEKAQEYYEQLANRWPGTFTAEQANDRIAFLSLPETQEFSRWFAKQKPQPRVPQPPAGITGPSPLDDLTNDSELSLPDESALEGARDKAPFDAMTPPDAQPETPDEGMSGEANESEDSIYAEPPAAETDAPETDDGDGTSAAAAAAAQDTDNPLREESAESQTGDSEPPGEEGGEMAEQSEGEAKDAEGEAKDGDGEEDAEDQNAEDRNAEDGNAEDGNAEDGAESDSDEDDAEMPAEAEEVDGER